MAEPQVNQILQALQFALNLKQNRAQSAQQRQEFEEEQTFRQKQLDAETDYRNSQIDLAKKSAAAVQAAQQHQMEQQNYQNLTQYQQTGIAPPGFTVLSPGLKPTAQQPLVLSGLENDVLQTPRPTVGPNGEIIGPPQQIVNVPPLGSSPVQQLLEHQQRIAEASKERETLATQQAETGRQLLTIAAQGVQRKAEINQEQGYISDRAKDQKAADMARTAVEGNTKLAVGAMESGLSSPIMQISPEGQITYTKNTSDQDLVGSLIQRGINGEITQEQIKAEWPKLAATVFSGITKAGGQAVTNKQQEGMKSLESMAAFVPILYRMNELNRDNPNLINFPNSEPAREFNALKAEAGKYIPGVAKAISTIPRLSNVDVNLYIKGLIPEPSIQLPLIGGTTSPKFEGGKYNDFVTKDVQDAFNTNTSMLPKAQRDIMRDNLGYNKFPYLKSAITAPGTSPAGIPGATPPQIPITPKLVTPQPTQPQKPSAMGAPAPRKVLPNAPVGEVNVWDKKNHVYGHISMSKYTENEDQFDIIPNKEK
jgi:hypothetical protein